jgi:hypothetical protein
MKSRRLVFLLIWMVACLQLPGTQIELAMATIGAVVIYIGLQLAARASNLHA